MNNTRKLLPASFTKNGFSHKLVRRKGLVAIYERTPLQGQAKDYEVVRIQEHEAAKVLDKKINEYRTIEAGEHYPSNEQWGTYGFTYTNIESAVEKFEALVEKGVAA